jgi:hypothetical protein
MLAYQTMTRLLPKSLAAVAGLAFAFSCLPASAQMYPQDIHAHSRNPSAPTQPAVGGINAFDSAAASLQRRQEEERERREMLERQRRMMENFTNIPDQLRESYLGRTDALRSRR